jgi:hypothetical protein
MPEDVPNRLANHVARIRRSRWAPHRLLARLPGALWRAPGRALDSSLERFVRPARLRESIRHVHGPEEVPCARDEVILISVVRNGAPYLDAFIEHHLALGVKHIVLLENDSTDDTIRAACRHARVTVLQTHLPYRHYENHMKAYLARRFSRDRWNLCCDIDELFDYPFSDRVGLGRLVGYLDSRGFGAVVAQMLDLFSDRPLSRLRDGPDGPIHSQHSHYDISDISKYAYAWSRLSNDAVKMHFGGIRRTLFGTENGLTKAALVLVRDGVGIFQDWHHATNTVVADFTCVLRHYPFTGAFYHKVREAAASGRYGRVTTDEYRDYWRVLAANPDLSLRLPTARIYEGPIRLLEQGFLVASPGFIEWASSQPAPDPGYGPGAVAPPPNARGSSGGGPGPSPEGREDPGRQ